MIGKFVKWTILTTAVLGGTGFVMFGTDLGSYLGTMASSIKQGVEDQIPVEFELKRAEKLIRAIEPQIESCKRDVARAEVELEDLQASVVILEQDVAAAEKRLKNGARMLGGDGEVTVELASDRLARRRVEVDLQRTLDGYRNNQAILKAKRTLIERQVQAVDAAKHRLSSVRTEKEVLEDQIAALKAQQHQVEALAASSRRFDLDDTALSQAKEVLGKVRKRLDVAQKMLENDLVWHGDDSVAVVDTRDVLREIREEFSPATAGVAAGGAPTAR